MKHCCEMMRNNVEQRCDVHRDAHECPDHLVTYLPQFQEYGLVIHDGGTSSVIIKFCPWCGVRLPESRRDQWFARLEAMGIDPWGDGVPAEFDDERWFGD